MYSNQEVLTQLYGPGLPFQPFVLREHQLEYALPLQMNYEVDLWGKIRSAYKSASLNEQAKQEAYNAALLLVTTELANAYFQVRVNDAIAEVYQRLIETRQTAYGIQHDRFEGELDNYTGVSLSDQDLKRVEARYFEVKQRREVFVNMVAVLLGKNPSEFAMEERPLSALPPSIPQSVPSAVLFRRPDLAEQQRRLESVHALLGVAYADYLPSVSVQGALGWNSPLSRFFFKSLSHFWMIGTNITELIFDGLAREYKVKLTWAQFGESVALYRQSVLNAFQEVENALSNLQWIGKEMQSIGQAVEESKINANIAADRYSYGVNSYLDVADKERALLDTEAIYLTLLGFNYTNTVQLIRSLGGGW
jgi:multidrug efflux system outer membrane protein